MFGKTKKDPLVDAVTKVMKESDIRYRVEQKLCEELGIYSKNALPNEHKVNYDALLEQRINEALHPNQQKLDVHKPKENKLTADDFTMLRARQKNRLIDVLPKKMPQGPEYAEKRRKARLADNGRMNEEEDGEETREGGAVVDTKTNKPVVSTTAPRSQPSGPTSAQRDALTNKIKQMKEAMLAGPETGSRKTPGSNQVCEEDTHEIEFADKPGQRFMASGKAPDTHEIEFADKPGQKFKASGKAPTAAKDDNEEDTHEIEFADKPGQRFMASGKAPDTHEIEFADKPGQKFKASGKADDNEEDTHEIEFADKPGQKFKASGKAPKTPENIASDGKPYMTSVYPKKPDGSSSGPGKRVDPNRPVMSLKDFEDSLKEELKKFAKTKRKGLPDRVKKEEVSFDDVMEEIARNLGKQKMKEIDEASKDEDLIISQGKSPYDGSPSGSTPNDVKPSGRTPTPVATSTAYWQPSTPATPAPATPPADAQAAKPATPEARPATAGGSDRAAAEIVRRQQQQKSVAATTDAAQTMANMEPQDKKSAGGSDRAAAEIARRASTPAARPAAVRPATPAAKAENPYEKYGANEPDAGPAAFFRADKEAMAAKPATPQAPAAPQAAKPDKFKGSIGQFRTANPGATLGQYMNAQKGLTARAGGANDPEVIASKKAPSDPVYVAKSGTTMSNQATTQKNVDAAREDQRQGAEMRARASSVAATTDAAQTMANMEPQDKKSAGGSDRAAAEIVRRQQQQKSVAATTDAAQTMANMEPQDKPARRPNPRPNPFAAAAQASRSEFNSDPRNASVDESVNLSLADTIRKILNG